MGGNPEFASDGAVCGSGSGAANKWDKSTLRRDSSGRALASASAFSGLKTVWRVPNPLELTSNP